MGVVADRRRSFSKKRRVLLAALLMAGGFLVAISVVAFENGPFVCTNNCLVQSPLVDVKTKQFIDQKLTPIDNWVPLWAYGTGATYIICNSTHCTTYHQTFSGEWVGENRTAIEGGGSVGGGLDGGWDGGGNGGNGGQQCVIVTKSGTGCVSTGGGGPKCEMQTWQTIECF